MSKKCYARNLLLAIIIFYPIHTYAEELDTLPWLKKEPVLQKPVVQKEKKQKLEIFLTFPFEKGQTDITSVEKKQLDSLAGKLQKDKTTRISLLSYAGEKDPIEARRTSLKRAISVRKYLIGKNIEQTRINVQVLGNTAKGKLKDQMEVQKL